MRETNEPPKALGAVTVRFVGTLASRIADEVVWVLDDPVAYRSMSEELDPYGEGNAESRVVAASMDWGSNSHRGGEQT